MDVFIGLGPKVFFLYTLAALISRLATVSVKNLLQKLRGWWKNSPHPHGLAVVVSTLYKANSISTLIPSPLKHLSSKVNPFTSIKEPYILNELLINIIRGTPNINLRLLDIKETF